MTPSKCLTVISFSHRNTGLDERDALSFERDDVESFVDLCRRKWSAESAVLTTCNRTEFYLHGPIGGAKIWPRLRPIVADLRGIEESDIPDPALFEDEAGARHLFRVASSLESVALGENQILGQIKDVHEQILLCAGKSPVLDRLFRYAIRVGKRVRTETGLCEGVLSISSAAVDLAAKIFGSFKDREILLVGAGETAETAAMHFQASGASRFVVVNRSEERGRTLANRFQGRFRPLDELVDACHTADVAVFATHAREHLLTHAHLKGVMKARGYRPIFLIDISNPRNVDPEVARYDSAFLYNIDDLEQVVTANMATRKGEIPAAEEIIDHMVAEWRSWQQSMQITPTISTLARFHEEIRRDELARHGSLSAEEQALLDDFSKGLIKKLLHNPIMYLRTAVDEDRLTPRELDLIWALYNLSETDEATDED